MGYEKGYTLLPKDAVYIGFWRNQQLWAGNFKGRFPQLVYFMSGEATASGDPVTKKWAGLQATYDEIVQMVDEKLGLMTDDARRAWVTGRIVRDEQGRTETEWLRRRMMYGQPPITRKPWRELSGLSESRFKEAVSVLAALGRATRLPRYVYIWGPPVTPIEIATL